MILYLTNYNIVPTMSDMTSIIKPVKQFVAPAKILADYTNGTPGEPYNIKELSAFVCDDSIPYEKRLLVFLDHPRFKKDDKFAVLYSNQCRNWYDLYTLMACASYHVYFDTTYYCDLECRHCISDAGPKQPMNFMPVGDITHYIEQAKTEDVSVCHFALFGGEPIFAEIHNKGYFEQISKAVGDKKMAFSTNGNWINGKHADYLIGEIIKMYETIPKFLFQISVSRFHKNSVENAKKIIQKLDSNVHKPINVNVHGFDFDMAEFKSQCDTLSTNNVHVRLDFESGIVSGGRAATIPNKTSCDTDHDAKRAIIIGNKEIPGNICFAVMKPCAFDGCNKMRISLHFTPDGQAFTRDRLNPNKKYITPIKTRSGEYRTYSEIIQSLSRQIFNNYKGEIER